MKPRSETKEQFLECRLCQSDKSVVIDSRPTPVGKRRRRECFDCGVRSTTYEVPETLLTDLENKIVDLTKQIEAFKTVISIKAH